jgi:hypothetical protein
MLDLSAQFHSAMPDGILSIDIPAVDWGEVFNIDELKVAVDLFIVMGYDYYWNGSGTAGPVGPLYSMTDVYDYSLCRTISAYQSKGLPDQKFVLGLPYYGRVWKTLTNTVPSGTKGYGTALTYANVRNNTGGNFSPENYQWEGNSFSSCYIYYENDDWNQCFIGLDRDLKKRYDQVNYRGLAGIGIWALGYDNGYDELWDAIRSKFTDCSTEVLADTIYDCGGPAWRYYNLEEYFFTLQTPSQGLRYLDFRSFSTEEGYDSLYLYSGTDSSLTLLGGYSGEVVPEIFSSNEGFFTLRFHSDGLTTAAGWEAIWHDGNLDVNSVDPKKIILKAYPNPFYDRVNIDLPADITPGLSVICYDIAGKSVPIEIKEIENVHLVKTRIILCIREAKDRGPSVYFLEIRNNNGLIGYIKLVSQ